MTKEVITVRLHPDTLKSLNEISEDMKISRTAVIQLALNQFVKQQEKEKGNGRKIPNDDLRAD